MSITRAIHEAAAPHCDAAATISDRLAHIRRQIERSAQRAGRSPHAVSLVAVSKTRGAEAILAAGGEGLRIFAENRVQEAAGKWPSLRPQLEGVELRLIGKLQTNKLRQAFALFDVIETLDRPRLAAAMASERQRSGHCPRLMIQVNTGMESQKAGVAPSEARDFIAYARDDLGLPVEGLMCIPPRDQHPGAHFRQLAQLREAAGLAWLSMGMSADYPTAIACGATHLRLGEAVFGPRPPAGVALTASQVSPRQSASTSSR